MRAKSWSELNEQERHALDAKLEEVSPAEPLVVLLRDFAEHFLAADAHGRPRPKYGGHNPHGEASAFEPVLLCALAKHATELANEVQLRAEGRTGEA
jgi:hypothetical protein